MFVTLLGLPRMLPALTLTAVPGIDREFPEVSAHALVVSLKFAASKSMYGVSVTAPVLEAGYEVPAPLAKVFQPAKVKPVLANGTFGVAEDPSLGAK
jgi:hypothetical protein